MDLLGTEGEKAAEGVENLSARLQDIESHLNALDTALQDLDNKTNELNTITQNIDHLYTKVESLENSEVEKQDEIDDLKEITTNLAKLERKNSERIKKLTGEESTIEEKLSQIFEMLNGLDNKTKNLDKRIDNVQRELRKVRGNVEDKENKIVETNKRINEIENEFLLDTNRQEWDLENKLDEPKFQRRKKVVDKEISKLRTSINVLAEELNKKTDIEID